MVRILITMNASHQITKLSEKRNERRNEEINRNNYQVLTHSLFNDICDSLSSIIILFFYIRTLRGRTINVNTISGRLYLTSVYCNKICFTVDI